MTARRVHLLASGRVQGVFFRASARDEAERLGLTGWARNRADGLVEIEVQGEPPAVDSFIDFCRRGPGQASVSHLAVTDHDPVSHERIFTIRPTSPS